MFNFARICGTVTADALNKLAESKNLSVPKIDVSSLLLETPPDPKMGDVGIPLFGFAKTFKQAPAQIAADVLKIINTDFVKEAAQAGTFSAVGPYINVRLNKAAVAASVLHTVLEQGTSYGALNEDGKPQRKGERIMIEFSSPNTNKPLHLGHLRNDAIGESVSRTMRFLGADVFKTTIINDRGVHICKSMLAYQKLHSAEAHALAGHPELPADTPESAGVKSDRFVGDCYVEYNDYAKSHPEAEKEAQDMLVRWENNDKSVRELWKLMNDWAIAGIKQTYDRTGISFDKMFFESDTYLKGREEILRGLEKGIFYKDADGAVWVDLAEINLDKKVLLRKDGTTVYITQDIGLAINRHAEWPFDKLIYVVATEQIYHFKVLFYIMKKLGYGWHSKLYHLAYGMVNLPEGKMKSREGTVVDADDLLNNLRDDALQEITAKGREEAVGNPQDVAEKVALAAVHYFLLQVSPFKDMIFNPKESLSFNGNTGPYLQYMGARMCSVLAKAEKEGLIGAHLRPQADFEKACELLQSDAEWDLIKLIGSFPRVLQKASEALDSASIAGYAYDTAKAFGKFYHDCPIVNADNADCAAARLTLTCAVLTVLKNALNLILVPFLEVM